MKERVGELGTGVPPPHILVPEFLEETEDTFAQGPPRA